MGLSGSHGQARRGAPAVIENDALDGGGRVTAQHPHTVHKLQRADAARVARGAARGASRPDPERAPFRVDTADRESPVRIARLPADGGRVAAAEHQLDSRSCHWTVQPVADLDGDVHSALEPKRVHGSHLADGAMTRSFHVEPVPLPSQVEQRKPVPVREHGLEGGPGSREGCRHFLEGLDTGPGDRRPGDRVHDPRQEVGRRRSLPRHQVQARGQLSAPFLRLSILRRDAGEERQEEETDRSHRW